MTIGSAPEADSCGACGGKGWKFMTLRRSFPSGPGLAERARVRRRRVGCLACDGTGRAGGNADRSEADDAPQAADPAQNPQ